MLLVWIKFWRRGMGPGPIKMVIRFWSPLPMWNDTHGQILDNYVHSHLLHRAIKYGTADEEKVSTRIVRQLHPRGKTVVLLLLCRFEDVLLCSNECRSSPASRQVYHANKAYSDLYLYINWSTKVSMKKICNQTRCWPCSCEDRDARKHKTTFFSF